jgi:enamine deaminase RidA (YjgF/YER057c/UK114 family)
MASTNDKNDVPMRHPNTENENVSVSSSQPGRHHYNRKNISSGSPWESIVGYSRVVRIGSHISVAGTTATDEDGMVVAPGNAYEQAKYVLKKIEGALKKVNAQPSDIVRTRMFVINIDKNWQDIGKAHGEMFSTIRPAATMVEVSRLIDPDHLVEIEVDAWVVAESTS